jgi:hypothetical protein
MFLLPDNEIQALCQIFMIGTHFLVKISHNLMEISTFESQNNIFGNQIPVIFPDDFPSLGRRVIEDLDNLRDPADCLPPSLSKFYSPALPLLIITSSQTGLQI